MRYYRILILSTVILGCKGAAVVQQAVPYSENLSVHRLDFTQEVVKDSSLNQSEILDPVELTGHIKTELDSINKIIIEKNKSRKYWDGYVIQVYNGNSRQAARQAINILRREYPEMNSVMSYYQPNYRVKVGKFFDRLAATKAYEDMKLHFPRALLLPDKLPISDE